MNNETAVCAGCGKDVSPGSLVLAAKLIRSNDDAGGVEVLYFCADVPDGHGFPIKGCLSKLLVPANMHHYISTHPDPEGGR